MGRAIVALLLCAACVPVIEEPPPQEVASRRQIAAGRFGSLGVDGSWDEGGFVLALRDPDETGGTLSVFPWDGAAECEVGRVAGYRTFGVAFDQGVVLSDDPIRIETMDAPAESGSLRIGHADATCGVQAPLVDEPLREPPFQDFSDPWRAFFAWTVSGDLFRVDPWAGESKFVAGNVTAVESSWYDDGDDAVTMHLWFVSDGVLHASDSDGDVSLALGTGVTEIATGCPVNWVRDVASLEGGCLTPQVAFAAADGLWKYDGTELERLSPVGLVCDLAWWTGNASDPYSYITLVPILTYLACDRLTLFVRDLATGEAESFTSDSEIGAVRRLPSGEIAYVHGSSRASTIGDAFAVRPGIGTIDIAGGVDLESIVSHFGQTILLSNQVGERGDLGAFSPEIGFFPLFLNVTGFSINGLLALLHSDGTLEVLDPLALLPSEVRRPESPILVATGVPRGGFRWSETTWALDYLEEFTPETGGTLRTWIVPDNLGGGGGPGPDEPVTGEQGFLVDEGVVEWREIQWPDAGELYTIGTGDRQGLWYADWVD